MLKKNKKALLLSSLVILLPILFGLAVWEKLPEQMATHFGADGKADGWSNRVFAVFAVPIFILIAHWFCVFCTAKDPRNKTQSSKVSGMVLWICPAASLYAGALTYTEALGKKIGLGSTASLFLGLLFLGIGNYLPKCKQNSTIGIRVKWTLESQENWNATHRFCGKIWTLGGILLIACTLLPQTSAMYVSLVLLAVLAVLPIGYSYYRAKQGR